MDQRHFFDLDDVEPTIIPEADCVDTNGNPILANLLTYVLISAEVLLPQAESLARPRTREII